METQGAARPTGPTEEAPPLLVVVLGADRWAAPTTRVVEIVEVPAVTPLPLAPPAVVGVAVLRGQPLVVLNPRPGAAPGSVALRWEAGGHAWLVAVDGVERLWRPDAAPLPTAAWQAMVPPEASVAVAYRLDAGWVWQWPDDLPLRLVAGREDGTREEGRPNAS